MDSYYNYKSSTPTTTTKQPPKAKKISISILVISLPLLYASLLHVPPSSLLRDTAFWFLISNSIIFIVAADFASSSAEQTTTSLYDEYIKHNRTRTACPPVLVVKEEVIEQAQEYSTPVQMQVKPEPADNADQKRSSEEPELAQPDMIEAEKGLKGSDESKLSHKINVVKDCPATELRPEPEPAVVNVKQPRLFERSRSELVETNAEATKNLLLPRSATAAGEKRGCGMEETEYWKMSDEELNNRVEEFIRRFNREIRLQERQMSAVY